MPSSLGEVWVVAPNREQSAVSHALTLAPARCGSSASASGAIAVDGTPTDCVALASPVLIGRPPPDLVVSGINFGANMGADVHYSGTVSAAFEGVILGVPALAVSQQSGEGFSFHLAAGSPASWPPGSSTRPAPEHAAQRQRAVGAAARASA